MDKWLEKASTEYTLMNNEHTLQCSDKDCDKCTQRTVVFALIPANQPLVDTVRCKNSL